MARHHRQANIRLIISNSSRPSSSITSSSRSVNPSGPNQWMILDRRWYSSKATEFIVTMCEMETVATIPRRHHLRWASAARQRVLNRDRATFTRRSRSIKIRCDTLSITCSRLIRAITTITRWSIRGSLECAKTQKFPFVRVNRIKMPNNGVGPE